MADEGRIASRRVGRVTVSQTFLTLVTRQAATKIRTSRRQACVSRSL